MSLEENLRAATKAARARAGAVGPLHSLWDLIFDAEALLENRPTLLHHGDREQAIAKLTAELKEKTP